MRKSISPARFAALFTLLSANQAWAQQASQPSLGAGILQMLLGLGGVLVLLVGSLWLLKRLTAVRGPGAGMMRVVAATAVGGRERVVIVEVGSTWLVLGVAPGRVSPLAEIPRQTLPETPQGNSQPAAEWLQRFIPRR
ncbi:MAG: flagellar biosynthetic protein FliO [Rhodocyclales bacterium]|nr:flagellar biosynthetic protein FliO [Rhodocyclales bacterium]